MDQDGHPEHDKHVTEVTHLMSRAGKWAAGLRWISNIVWARYYIEVMRDALLVGAGWVAMWSRVGMIALIGACFYLVAWRSMRRMQLKD